MDELRRTLESDITADKLKNLEKLINSQDNISLVNNLIEKQE